MIVAEVFSAETNKLQSSMAGHVKRASILKCPKTNEASRPTFKGSIQTEE